MFHVKHFPPVKSLLAACRGADWRGGGLRKGRGRRRLAAHRAAVGCSQGGGWLLTGRRLAAHRAAVDGYKTGRRLMATRQGGGWIANRAAVDGYKTGRRLMATRQGGN